MDWSTLPLIHLRPQVKVNVMCDEKKLDITVRTNADESQDTTAASDLIWCYLSPIAFNAIDLLNREWPGLLYKVYNYFYKFT